MSAARAVDTRQDDSVSDRPDDAAYGRVTRPERYAPLPGFARRLIDNLLVEYDAEISHDEASASSDAVGEVGDAMRVCPRFGAGGCLAVRETSFPGVVLEIGL